MRPNHTFAPKAFPAIAIAMFLVQLAPAGSAGTEQSWHLTDYEPTGAVALRSMNNTNAPKKGTADVGLATAGSARIWRADIAASAAVDMSGDWQTNIEISYSSQGSGQRTVTIQIGKWNESAGFTRCSASGTTLQISPGETKTYCTPMATVSHVIMPGDYLALKIYYNSSASGGIYAITSNATGDFSPSWIKSPSSCSGYPTPELPSLALFISGIIIAPCISFLGRRRR
ncbi:MAG: hypothetical protein PHH26_06655 [Candidatus Thermoplasmatota archaeon]|nr:hypothetical protein [Candidatus Thermoplasmatota archaeon]